MNSKSILHLFAFLLIATALFAASEVKAACTDPSVGGSYTISASCAFDTSATGGVHGVSNGGITINEGITLTVNAGQTIVWSPGQSIVVNGSIAINDTGQLQQTNLWMVDADADGYPLNKLLVAQDSSPGGSYRERKNMTSYTILDVDSDTSFNDTNYAYSQSAYYSYAQGAYYNYAQGAYYNYSQGTYPPATKLCQAQCTSFYEGYTHAAITTACATYCGAFSPSATCTNRDVGSDSWDYCINLNFSTCTGDGFFSAEEYSNVDSCQLSNHAGDGDTTNTTCSCS